VGWIKIHKLLLSAQFLEPIERCSDDVFLQANPKLISPLFPQQKAKKIHKWAQLLWILKPKYSTIARNKKLKVINKLHHGGIFQQLFWYLFKIYKLEIVSICLFQDKNPLKIHWYGSWYWKCCTNNVTYTRLLFLSH